MGMKLSDRVYDTLKWLVIIVMPAAATLYAALSAVWGWPHTQEIVTTIAAGNTFLGSILCISKANYSREE